MTIEQIQVAKPEELDYNLAYQAYRNVSFDADNRAKDEQDRFAFSVNSLYAELSKVHNNPAQIEYLDRAIQEYKISYLAKRSSYLRSLSNVASVMIAGPSNFNTSRNQKRSNTSDNRLQEFIAWDEQARKSLQVNLISLRDEDQKLSADWKKLEFEINRSLGVINDIDSGTAYWSRPAFVNSIVGMVKTQAEKGNVEIVKRALALVDRYNENAEKPAIGPKHKFWLLIEVAQTNANKN